MGSGEVPTVTSYDNWLVARPQLQHLRCYHSHLHRHAVACAPMPNSKLCSVSRARRGRVNPGAPPHSPYKERSARDMEKRGRRTPQNRSRLCCCCSFVHLLIQSFVYYFIQFRMSSPILNQYQIGSMDAGYETGLQYHTMFVYTRVTPLHHCTLDTLRP